jgi:hypothetical protein
MAAVACQLSLGRIWAGALVEVHHHDSSVGPGETKIAPAAVDQRNQQAERQQQDERQTAKPASGSCSCYCRANLHHLYQRTPRIRRFQGPVYQKRWSSARAQGDAGPLMIGLPNRLDWLVTKDWANHAPAR